MSLVAYGSSGESCDEEDRNTELKSDNQVLLVAVEKHANSSSISQQQLGHTDSSSKMVSNRTSLGGILPPPMYHTADVILSDVEESYKPLFSSLPPPMQSDHSSGVESDDVVDDVPLAVIKPPNVAKKRRQPIKITVPSLSEFEGAEESAGTKKKLKPSQGSTDLFALLPPPKYMSVKTTNRVLIPHSMSSKTSKKPSNAKPVVRKQDPTKPHYMCPSQDQAESDEDEDEVTDFFSLSSQLRSSCADQPSLLSAHIYPKLNLQIDKVDTLQTVMSHSRFIDSTETYSGETLPSPHNWPQQSSKQELASTSLTDEALLQLRGRSRRRKEEINIIDVNTDDVLPDRDEWARHISEEKVVLRPKKGDGPTSQQRRKHQITYLAFQAKEKELELKNQWAENRLNKRQTQSKYGF